MQHRDDKNLLCLISHEKKIYKSASYTIVINLSPLLISAKCNQNCKQLRNVYFAKTLTTQHTNKVYSRNVLCVCV